MIMKSRIIYKAIAILLGWLFPLVLLANSPLGSSFTQPFGLQVGQSNLAQLEQQFSDEEIHILEDPARQLYRGIALDMPGWRMIELVTDKPTTNAFWNEFSIYITIDEQDIIQRIQAFYSDKETAYRSNYLFMLVSRYLRKHATRDHQFRLFEQQYNDDVVMALQDRSFLHASITKSLDIYRHNQTNYLLGTGYGGEVTRLPEGLMLREMGDIGYTELPASSTDLAWVEDDRLWVFSLIITSNRYQQVFRDNLAKAVESGKVSGEIKALLEKDLAQPL
ncbi:hypothetical protein L0B52_04575 [Suttonella sp. R2A3]|uniref:hypothetical protein n=1 Tax=Suttonella sp. R2A3 TaxID=2908648 RepID=UPI001F24AFD1|nr:hypothetical protein [Suttonella sp. R2A3]UJF25425.1 hypothetical protein L0B52_04575 [Suttonella sp. R2A3]